MRLSLLLALALLLSPVLGVAQSLSSLRSSFVDALFDNNSRSYESNIEYFISDPKNATEKADAEALLSTFKLLNSNTSEQPYACQFNQIMREVGLSFSATATTNPYLQLLKVKVKGQYVVILKNTHRQNGYMAYFTGASLDKTSTSRFTRGIGPYKCARMDRTEKPYKYAYTGAKANDYGSYGTIPCP